MGLMGVGQVLVEGGQLQPGIAVIVGPGERGPVIMDRKYHCLITDQGSSASAVMRRRSSASPRIRTASVVSARRSVSAMMVLKVVSAPDTARTPEMSAGSVASRAVK